MGPKITIDSATLMNKGLELIEAHFLFGLPYDRIEVVVHPTSVVHALVRFRDGAALAHLGYPDMRVPISYALTYPGARRDADRAARPRRGLILEFSAPGRGGVPCLALARAAGEAGGNAPCVLNAANEVAVAAFLDGGLPFLGIAEVVERTPEHDGPRRRARPRRARRHRRRGAADCGGAHARSWFTDDVNIAVAIGGLAFLILIHEAGHFFTALAVKMRPRQFYIFFPPALVKWKRNGIEYGIGAIPLGGYVKIPGMHKPAGGDLEAQLAPGVDEAPWLAAAVEPVEHALSTRAARGRAGGARRPAGRASVAPSSPRARARPRSAASPTSTTRSRPTPTGARRPGSGSRSSSPGRSTNLVFAVVLLAVVFMLGVPSQVDRTNVDRGRWNARGRDRAAPGDRSSRSTAGR